MTENTDMEDKMDDLTARNEKNMTSVQFSQMSYFVRFTLV